MTHERGGRSRKVLYCYSPFAQSTSYIMKAHVGFRGLTHPLCSHENVSLLQRAAAHVWRAWPLPMRCDPPELVARDGVVLQRVTCLIDGVGICWRMALLRCTPALIKAGAKVEDFFQDTQAEGRAVLISHSSLPGFIGR